MRENRRSAEEPLGFGIRKREVQGLCVVPDMLFGGRGNNGEEIHRLLQKPGETDLGNRAVLLLCELFRPGETGTVDGGVILQNGALAQALLNGGISVRAELAGQISAAEGGIAEYRKPVFMEPGAEAFSVFAGKGNAASPGIAYVFGPESKRD